MKLEFTKMHGLGNDFVVINAIDQKVDLDSEQCRYIADRHFGVGCDQILLVEPARENGMDFYYRIFNADGSEVEQCGNGARCFAQYVRAQGLTDQEVINVGTLGGNIQLHIKGGLVQVDMGPPVLEPAEIPFQAEQQAASYPLLVDGEEYQVGAVSMGNPHVVLRVDAVESAPVATLGPLLESHPRFPQRVNVGFMQVCSLQHIRLRVFERGTGETMACGTGACAAVVCGQLQGLLGREVRVSLPGGDLMIEWGGGSESVQMSGPAATVYEGKISL